jgi:hypothetical protein
MQALNIPTKINKGTVEITTDVQLIRIGEKVRPNLHSTPKPYRQPACGLRLSRCSTLHPCCCCSVDECRCLVTLAVTAADALCDILQNRLCRWAPLRRRCWPSWASSPSPTAWSSARCLFRPSVSLEYTVLPEPRSQRPPYLAQCIDPALCGLGFTVAGCGSNWALCTRSFTVRLPQVFGLGSMLTRESVLTGFPHWLRAAGVRVGVAVLKGVSYWLLTRSFYRLPITGVRVGVAVLAVGAGHHGGRPAGQGQVRHRQHHRRVAHHQLPHPGAPWSCGMSS